MLYPYLTNETKEEHNMKTAALYSTGRRCGAVSYPNGVTRRQIIQKVVDLLLTAAIGIGIAAILLFLLALA